MTRPKPAKLSRRYARSHCVMFVNHVSSSLTRKAFTVICDKHCVVVFVVNVLVFEFKRHQIQSLVRLTSGDKHVIEVGRMSNCGPWYNLLGARQVMKCKKGV